MNKVQRIWEWIEVYLVPGPVYRFFYKIKHPRLTYALYKNHKWVKSLKPGDIICDCRGEHIAIRTIDPDGYIVTEDDISCDAYHCISPVMEDNSCHGVMTDILKWYKNQDIPIPASLLRYYGYHENWFGTNTNMDA